MSEEHTPQNEEYGKQEEETQTDSGSGSGFFQDKKNVTYLVIIGVLTLIFIIILLVQNSSKNEVIEGLKEKVNTIAKETEKKFEATITEKNNTIEAITKNAKEEILEKQANLTATLAIVLRNIVSTEKQLVGFMIKEILKSRKMIEELQFIAILDPEGKVIFHTDSKYFDGMEMKDELSKKALVAEKLITTPVEGEKDVYDIACPINSATKKEAVIRVGVKLPDLKK